jgi:hypothetical protein
MKLSFFSLSCALLVLAGLTSCDSTHYDVKEPTREQMLALDRQWGLPEINKTTKPRSSAATMDDDQDAQAAKGQGGAPMKPAKPAPPLPDPVTAQ